MGAMKDIYTVAVIISDLENRMNELEELCLAIDEADDEFGCDCEVCDERNLVWSQLKRLHKQWMTYPVAHRNDAWLFVQEEKKVNA